MPSSSEIVPDRSSPEHGVSANHHSTKEVTQATDSPNVTEETPAPRRTRPSRACTVRAQQRLQEQQASERKFRPPKKEQKRRREEVEDVDDPEEDESPSNGQQCDGGSAAKIVTSLVQPPEPSQVSRRNIRSMWELASILNFLHVFRPLLNIKVEFSAEELETALLTPNDTLSDVHIPLLKAIPPIARMALTSVTWVTVLCRKLRDWWHWVAEGDLPIVASHGLEIEVYKSLDPGIRVVILKALCDIRVEQEDIRGYIESSLKSGVHLSTFRKDRVGGDSHGVNFWYEDDALIGHRLYREIRKAEVGKVRTKGSKVPSNVTYQWETVATNLDEFLDVSEKLFSSNSRTEASLGKKLKSDMLPEIEKEHKRKEKLSKKQHRQALLLDNFLEVDGFGAGRSLRDRKPVTYTFDDYDRSINEAIKITKEKPPSLEPSLHRRKPDELEASANGGLTSSTHPSEAVNGATSVRSSDFADDEDVNEQRAESVDRSNRRRQRPQRYSSMDFVETVSDNDVEFETDDDIAGEAVYDEEYLKKHKQRKEISSASEGDEEYRWEDDNANEEEDDEEEDSSNASEEDSDEPQRYRKMPRRNTKLRSRSKHLQPGLRRSKRATRVNYQQYELSESDNEGTRRAKSRRLVERDEHSDETENNDLSMGSQDSEEIANDPETQVDEEEEDATAENDKEEANDKENGQLHAKSNGTDQEEVDGIGKRHYLDLNELAPPSGFDDGPNTVLKDDDNNTDNS